MPDKPINVIYPRTNSLSPKEEQLAEYRETCLDIIAQNRMDMTKDPLIFWKPVDYDPRFPNTDITK